MTEPLFFDCLTDAQFWSLFDSGVLQSYMLPGEVYERLERIAPGHDCYLFTWPADIALPSLQDLLPSLAVPTGQPPAQTDSHSLRMRLTVQRIRAEIAVFRARVHTDMPPTGARIHVISTHPCLELRAGPYLEPPAHDLHAMSLPELEAYLDAVLRIDASGDADSAASSASR